MRISTKITIAISTAGFLLFGTYGFFTLQEEKADLRHSVEREVRLLLHEAAVGVQHHVGRQQHQPLRRHERPVKR